MKPILFEKDATDFKTQGIGTLTDIISGTVTEELNGTYEAEITYPISGRYFKEIKKDRIMLLPHDDSDDLQAFRIYKLSKPINGIVTINLEHISYELNKMTLAPFSVNSCEDFFHQLAGKIIDPQFSYTFTTDISLQREFSIAVPRTVRSALGGESGSALDVCGYGEFVFDNRNVSFKKRRGVDSGVTIRYGKNLTDLTYEVDTTNEITGIVPYYASTTQTTSTDSDGNTTTESKDILVTVDGYVVTRKEADKTKVVPVDLSSSFDHEPTKDELKAAAATYLATNGKSTQSVTISFIALWQTEEYKNVASLQRLYLGDTANVSYSDLGVDLDAEIIKTTYNVLSERYDSMELGSVTSNISKTISQNTKEEIKNAFSDFADVYNSFISQQTDKLTGGVGGYIVINRDANGKPTEILAMDTDSKGTATQVLRINKNGIGFSKNGYSGPYETAWTIDGKFNANFIMAGIIQANLIKGGILSDASGRNSWNMETGELNLSILSTVGGKTIANTESVQAVSDKADKAQETADAVKKTSIKSVQVQYAQGDSNTEAPSAGWQEDAPAWKSGQYIWQRTATTMSDDTVVYSKSLCITGIQGEAGKDGQDAILLMIDSTNGNLFKNSDIATILTVTVITGDTTITNSTALKKHFGSGAHLVWKTKPMGETEWTTVDSASDKLNDNGFLFTISPKDIDTKCQFACELEA